LQSPSTRRRLHTCLLFSRLYADLCQQVFGEFFHHEPATAPEPNRATKFREFEQLYTSTYGQLGRLWEWARPGA
jgi:hypothetical protein